MKLRLLKNKKGMALLMTVTITTLLVTATIELNRKVRATVENTATIRDRLTLSHLASSGLNAGIAMLIKDKMSDPPKGLDSIQEDWANPEKISEVLQDIPLDEGRVTFKITDELGKIQINALVRFPEGNQYNDFQRALWYNLLQPVVSQDDTLEPGAIEGILDSLKDWIDPDEDIVTGLNGAESDYYESLEPPYKCKNGPMIDLDEIFLVKNMKREFFQSLGISTQVEGFTEASESPEKTPRLSDYVTVLGMEKIAKKVDKRDFTFQGKININTAPLPVLMALVGPDYSEYAQAIYDYRAEKEDTNFVNSLVNPEWYRNIPEIPNDFQIRPELITYSSDIFRIEATATLHDMKETISIVVQREKSKESNKWRCRVLSWELL
jgi:general secretion pathway protein K